MNGKQEIKASDIQDSHGKKIGTLVPILVIRVRVFKLKTYSAIIRYLLSFGKHWLSLAVIVSIP